MHPTLQLQGKRQQQSVTAATDCYSTKTSRLFVTDQASKHRFLVDTGSDICCFPRRLLKGKYSASSFDLCAANGSIIKTYGFLNLSLNLNLRRAFIWKFVIADVDTVIIGSDFLAYYNLLPDCSSKRLIDKTTNVSTVGKSDTSNFLSVKTVNFLSPYHSILSEFPEITRPVAFPRKVKHNTVHYIKTTPGPPVFCKPRRLHPKKLTIAKREFDDMLKIGTCRPLDSPWASLLHLGKKGVNQ